MKRYLLELMTVIVHATLHILTTFSIDFAQKVKFIVGENLIEWIVSDQ
jgi:hypothetical protein